MNKKIVFYLLILLCVKGFSQVYPQQYFESPLEIPLFLAGNFGEIRGSHFHTGLDLKTQGKQGYKVMSVADGYISRVKIGWWGYGKAIYIKHPNGYETVYGHLQRFSPDIEKRIKQYQYQKQSYELDITFKPNEITVHKGEHIAFSGNTGSSLGPHLHFEIRDSFSHPLNPLHFGYRIADDIKPTVDGVYVYALSDTSQINGNQRFAKINITPQKDGTYLADEVQAYGNIGFGVKAIDYQNKSRNKNGVYRILLSVNGVPYLEYAFDKLSFSESKYLSTFIDYKRWIEQKVQIQQLFKTKSNQLSTIYKQEYLGGEVLVESGFSYNITIELFDFEGNTTKIRVPVKGVFFAENHQQLKPEGVRVSANRDAYFNFDGGSVYFPKGAFFSDFYFQMKKQGDTISIHNETQPVKNDYTLKIKASNADTLHTYIAYINNKNRPVYQKTNYLKKDRSFVAKVRNLGRFTLMRDTIAPKIEPIAFSDKSSVKSAEKLQVKITDESSGIQQYRAFLNGKWILMEYEPKTDLLTFDFSDFQSYPQENILQIEVEDNAKNKATVQFTIYR